MAKILSSISLNYNDVNLLAQLGAVKSRKEIPIQGNKIVVSAMSSIVGETFIEAVYKLPEELRPTIHIPRDRWSLKNMHFADKYGLHENVFVGVGLNDTDQIENIALGYGFKTAFIDIANGYLPQIPNKVKELREKGFEVVICGSVHTEEGYNYLANNCDVDIIRSGIAPGSVCITSDSTGFTRGTISEILALSKAKSTKIMNPLILADGGIKSPSDCVKAFLAGADYIMSGRLFISAVECRMHSDGYDDLKTQIPENTYFGMASLYGKMCMGKEFSEHIEGKIDGDVPSNNTLKNILTTLWEGIRSGISYSGYSNLDDAIGNGVFEIKQK